MLFWLLFLPGLSLPGEMWEVLPFSAIDELYRVLLRDLPALALVWYLLRHTSRDSVPPKTKRADAAVAFVVFLILVGISTGTSLLASWLPWGEAETAFEAPIGALDWLVAALACAATGYLEESYFRLYLIEKLGAAGIPKPQTVAVSVTLFALCHLYEGPWGTLNAAAAGTVLALVFFRFRSLHPLAWAHAAYNLFVYSAGAF